jgi:orotate phosphoribosyltransferase
MNETEVLAALESHGALQHGHFKLSSGLHSDVFVQTALATQWPGLAERFGHELAVRFEDLDPTVVLGPAVAGIVIGHEVARRLGVRMVFTERADGAMTLRRSFELARDDRVVVAENVVTTGGSQREAIECVTRSGAELVGVGAIIDRSPGVDFGVRFESLARIEANAWTERECPLCASGEPIAAPGSRHLTNGR